MDIVGRGNNPQILINMFHHGDGVKSNVGDEREVRPLPLEASRGVAATLKDKYLTIISRIKI